MPGCRFRCLEQWLVNIGYDMGEVHMSIKKIAEKAGVSISTVSRILNRPDYKCSSARDFGKKSGILQWR